MTTKQRRGVVGIMGIFFLALVLVGCTTIYEFPMDPVLYRQEDKIDLKVGLHLSEELRNAKWERKQQGDTFIIRLGKALCENAEALSRELFSGVLVTSDIGSPPKVRVDAILVPRMVSAERTRPMYIFQEQTTTIILEWMMKDMNGDLIWVDTITGEGKAPMGGPFGEKKNARKQVERALKELFQKSFEAISSSVEIREFTATH